MIYEIEISDLSHFLRFQEDFSLWDFKLVMEVLQHYTIDISSCRIP